MIYENNEQNDAIKELGNKINIEKYKITSITENNLETELNLLLPYTSKRLTDATLEADVIIQSTPGINLTDAISYAATYAVNPNTSTPFDYNYQYFVSGDCTNFVSQILENGGISQVKSTSQYSGWWHNAYMSYEGVILHEHSISWINANTFANYMGIGYTTKSHMLFSSNLTKGSIIGFDGGSDGDWDHMAFVTDKLSYSGTYGTKTYYNYRVAQHTSNYHEWTSSSTNGWETLEDSGYTYGIIRE